MDHNIKIEISDTVDITELNLKLELICAKNKAKIAGFIFDQVPTQ